jgi:hypothetical protein
MRELAPTGNGRVQLPLVDRQTMTPGQRHMGSIPDRRQQSDAERLPGFHTPQVVISKADPKSCTEKVSRDLQAALRTGRVSMMMGLGLFGKDWIVVPPSLTFLLQVDEDANVWLDLRATETAAEYDVEDIERALRFADSLRLYYQNVGRWEGRPVVLVDQTTALKELQLAAEPSSFATKYGSRQARGTNPGRAKSAASNRIDHRKDDEPFTKEARRRIEDGEKVPQVVSDIAPRMPSKRGASTASKASRLHMRLRE